MQSHMILYRAMLQDARRPPEWPQRQRSHPARRARRLATLRSWLAMLPFI